MNITDYLKSEQARAAVAEMLAMPRWQLPFEIEENGPWKRITHDAGVRCYFRPEVANDQACNLLKHKNRFIVTDLGEALLALRLRTGIFHIDAIAKVRISLTNENGVFKNGADVMSIVDAEILPDAICSVMLASYEVSRL
jgi:hypothetical protein